MRKVRSNGEIRWGGAMIFLSEALIDEPVGIAETEAGDWLVRFAEIDLGIVDRRTKKLRRFTAARPPRHRETPGPAVGAAGAVGAKGASGNKRAIWRIGIR